MKPKVPEQRKSMPPSRALKSEILHRYTAQLEKFSPTVDLQTDIEEGLKTQIQTRFSKIQTAQHGKHQIYTLPTITTTEMTQIYTIVNPNRGERPCKKLRGDRQAEKKEKLGLSNSAGEKADNQRSKLQIAFLSSTKKKCFSEESLCRRLFKLRDLVCQAAIKNFIIYVSIYPQNILRHSPATLVF